MDPQFLADAGAWLPDYALFEVLTRAFGGAPFWRWPQPLRDRVPAALDGVRRERAAELQRVEREQYAFHLQFGALREYAQARGVRLFGDLPFYVAPSSAETWGHREFFQLQDNGEPAAFGGVPPDYFTANGQSWGNPLYDWGALARRDFDWWTTRLALQLARLDLLRLDHFRAFAAHWAIPAGRRMPVAAPGRAHPGRRCWPRSRPLPDLPLVAEDLGVITPDVIELMQRFGLPACACCSSPSTAIRPIRTCPTCTGVTA